MSRSDGDDYLKALYIMGFILVATTILGAFLLLLIAALDPDYASAPVGGSAFAIGSIILSGIIAMAYATFKRHVSTKKTACCNSKNNFLGCWKDGAVLCISEVTG